MIIMISSLSFASAKKKLRATRKKEVAEAKEAKELQIFRASLGESLGGASIDDDQLRYAIATDKMHTVCGCFEKKRKDRVLAVLCCDNEEQIARTKLVRDVWKLKWGAL